MKRTVLTAAAMVAASAMSASAVVTGGCDPITGAGCSAVPEINALAGVAAVAALAAIVALVWERRRAA